ncbi:MAG TPA: LysE family translocator [Prolixibacteraceae bacterium]|nr:LysE family translocator [Prolixibacteraceae bacterium]
MDLHLLWKGVVTGLAVSIPLGPLGILCIQRTVNKNWKSGIFSGAGVAAADTVYALVAGFSLSIILEFIRTYELYFKLVGLFVLILLGIYIFRSNPTKQIQNYKRRGSSHLQDFLTTFLITLSNPLSVFVFVAIFTSYSIVLQFSHPLEAFLTIGGIFIGGVTWWISITGLANLFRHKFTINALYWANRIIGLIVIVIAVVFFIYLQIKGI